MTAFAADRWRDFQKLPLMLPLLREHPSWQTLQDWPEIAEMQMRADELNIWHQLPKRLEFEYQKILGQRARRKQKNRTRYEVAIMDQGKIPTRAQNLHDLFNALIWIHYPESKWALHRTAYESVAEAENASGTRSSVCDRLTCFDEGGIILRVPRGQDVVATRELILSRDNANKQRYCESNRDAFFIFGHGILEVLFEGKTSVFASCAVVEGDDRPLDASLAAYIRTAPDQGGIDMTWILGT